MGVDLQGSGGYLDNIFLFAARELFEIPNTDIVYKRKRNDDLEEVILEIDGVEQLKFLKAYGFKNIQNVTKRVKRNKSKYHYIEIMACPGGCGNGSAMIRPSGGILERRQYVKQLGEILLQRGFRPPEENQAVKSFYAELEMAIGDSTAHELFHTSFQAHEPTNANISW